MDFSDHKTLIILLVILVILIAIMYKYRSHLMGMFKPKTNTGGSLTETTGLGSIPLNTFGGARTDIPRRKFPPTTAGGTLTVPTRGLGTYGGSDNESAPDTATDGEGYGSLNVYGSGIYSVNGNGSYTVGYGEYDEVEGFGKPKDRNRVKLFVDEATFKAIEAGTVKSVIISAGKQSFVDLLNKIVKNEKANVRVSCKGITNNISVVVTKVTETKSSNLKEVIEKNEDAKFNAYNSTAEYIKSFRSDPSKANADGNKPQLVIVHIKVK